MSAPTEKMLKFAQTIAQRLGIELPATADSDFDVCKAFIDENKEAAEAKPMPPTDKQLKFAESIAGRKQIAIPDDARNNSKELSKWIDANK